ncbi:MAG: Branched-chain amino acid transport ATP-binding protein LivG [Candidatus Ozemobacter sibiricus]|uniref:Branched-chain amino acid transport ATP-binding protein LivG n=1 Tax=Candidatus Ozemobacter sibiricus TaxID=2268124 RepID=A0A367ZUC1_9BACT|nr:MAG: Branched-chain amino acid transport ATP-binding protein LivG [Candidatus Ozemobacter sibiricus]
MGGRWRRGDLVGLGLLAALAVLPWVVGDRLGSFAWHVLIQVLLFAAMAQSWNIIGGYAGQVSFGHSVFFGIGAYGAGLAVVKYGLSPWPGVVGGAVAAALVAVAVSWPCFQLKGHYFAIATFAIVEIFHRLFLVWEWVNGALGLDYPMVEEGWRQFVWYENKTGYYYGALALAGLVFGVVRWLDAARFGAWLRAVRAGQEVAESLGVDSRRLKLAAMALSAFLTALCGAFFVQYNLRVDPPMVMSLEMSMKFVLITILGGIGTLWGPLMGAAVLLPLQETTRSLWGGLGGGVDLMVFGLLIIIVVVRQPDGLLGWLHRRGRTPAAEPAGGGEPPVGGEAPVAASLVEAEEAVGRSPAVATARPAERGQPLLELQDVTVRFGSLVANDRVSFTVESGAIVGLIGPNGAGKTTLFNAISGMVQPAGGTIRFGGQDITGWPAHRIARLGAVRTFQVVRPFREMTVLENVMVGAFVKERNPGRAAENARRCLELCHLGGLEHRLAGDLPIGHKKRLEMARALATEPRLLMLDESVAGLNSGEVREAIAVIRGLRDAGGVTILLVEHIMEVVMSLADRVVVLDGGVRIAEGRPREVVHDPRVVEAYFGEKFARRLQQGASHG